MSAGDSSVRLVFSRPIHSGRLLMMSENCKILEALTHMANLGIVHRDLKPSNLLIGESRRSAELFVFILAETISSSHLKNQIVRTASKSATSASQRPILLRTRRRWSTLRCELPLTRPISRLVS